MREQPFNRQVGLAGIGGPENRKNAADLACRRTDHHRR
jgi:hypothetical protein